LGWLFFRCLSICRSGSPRSHRGWASWHLQPFASCPMSRTSFLHRLFAFRFAVFNRVCCNRWGNLKSGTKPMQKVEVRSGLTIACGDDWCGPPWTTPQAVVLVHGNCESSQAWTEWVPRLAHGYRVIRLDLPGFGASTAPADYRWTAAEVAADLTRFLDALALARCHLIGAKYGGSIALSLASLAPQRFLSLCVFGSPARGVGTGNVDKMRAKGVRQWAAETMRARLGSTASQAQVEWWTKLMGATDERAAIG